MPPTLFLFLRNALSVLGLIVPYEFQGGFFYFRDKCHWTFDRMALTLSLALGSRDVSPTLILPARAHRRASHFSVSSLPFFSVLHVAFNPPSG